MSLFYGLFQHLLPTGKAFRLTPGKTIGKFFLGLSGFAKDARLFVDLIWEDLFPDTTRELPAWEEQHGLSGQGDDEGRIASLKAEWQAQGGQSLHYLQGLLRAAGFDVTLHEHWVGGRSPFELGRAYYAGRNLLASSAFSGLKTFDFGNNGKHLFCIVDYQGQWILVRLDLPTPYRLENLAYLVQAISLDGQDTAPESVKFKPDGSGFWMLGGNTQTVYEYRLGSPWNLATASPTEATLAVGAQEAAPTGMAPSTDGAHLYVVGNSATVFQYDFSESWELGTGSYSSKNYSPPSGVPSPAIYGIDTSKDGSKLFLLEFGPELRQHEMSTAWDVSTAQLGTSVLEVDAEAGNTIDIVFGGNGGQVPGYNNGTRLFTASASGDFFQYSVADYEVRNPHDYLTTPNRGRVTCGGSNNTCQGDYPGVPNVDVVCSTDATSDADYLVNKDLTNRAPPPIPQDPNTWPFFFYVGGETFGDPAFISPSRRNEFERLLLKFRPAHLWIGLLVTYEGGFILTDDDGFILTDDDGFILTN